MKSFAFGTVLLAASAAAFPISIAKLRRADVDAATIAALAPPLGFSAGVNPDGTGSCDGAVDGADGKPIKIPCSCPPSNDAYVAALTTNVQAGHQVNNTGVLVNFPTDDSVGSQQARITAALETLQNLVGPGKGCPAVSTTLQALSKTLDGQAANNAAPAASAPAAPAASSASAAAAPASSPAAPTTGGAPTPAQIAQLAPPLGFSAGVNPDGTGSCDGAVNGADGKPIKIPCSCPPSNDAYVAALTANVQAGHQVNNTGVLVSFPTDGSVGAQQARITAALETLQNLVGPGKGCPAVSTTLQALSKSLDGQAANNAAPAASTPAAPAAAAPAAPAAATPAAAPPASGAITLDQVSQLAPDLGFQANVNPDGTGSCDGAVNGADGKPIKIPCSCPPERASFVQALFTNVQAGHQVNNTGVATSFPTDGSVAAQQARITASLETLQNLVGPGKGCPAVATTLQAQSKALGN